MIQPVKDDKAITFADCKVLFVDDENDILKALKRVLRNEPYSCLFAETPAKALSLIQEQSIQAIVSDMRMPDMSGDQLLAQVQKQSPQTIRLILSSWSDSNSILQAINNGRIYRYIVKPWDTRDLKITIRQALELYNMQAEKQHLMRQLEAHNKNLSQTVARRTEQLLALNKQAEIGKYASQIVHNLKNPLHAVTGALDLARLILAEAGDKAPANLANAIDMALRGVGDLQRIITGILQHARDERRFHLEKVDVNLVIQQELDYFTIDPVFRNQVEKKIELAPELPAIIGSGVQIKQIINNLVANAIHAMENTSQRVLKVRTAVSGGSILIEVADTGTGIAPANLPFIFSPDFSTKPAGKGTGLGLASAKAMVDAYAGDILVSSEEGRGTCFTVSLPIKSHTITSD